MPVPKRKPKSSLAKLKAKYEAILARDGLTPEPKQIPHWHRDVPQAAVEHLRGRGSFVSVRLPSDGSRSPCAAERTLITQSNRECAEVINARLSDWVWRLCDWNLYPKADRKVMELHVIEGWFADEIATRLKMGKRHVYTIMATHRALAGV